jgi:alanine transaminase
MSSTPRLRSLNIDNINPHVKEAKYAVRGELAIKSEEYRAQLRKGDPPTPPESPLPFDAVISANIGNPQQLDQKPITFFRQVLSLVEYPPLLETEDVLRDSLGYKQDVIDRARWLLKEVKSVGAYSMSAGAMGIRESVAKYIERRDGFPASSSDIYLSAGASSGVNTLLHIIAGKPETGILVPIPQYPLYTATLAVLNARCVPYYLDESKAWGTDLNVIKESYNKAVEEGTDVRAIVVINPGNPTGASLSAEDVKEVIKFAAEKQLVIMADEVYQTNVFIGKFTSFKKSLREMQKENPGKYDTVELASLHSISKGMVGECGHRGGYFELIGFDQEVQAQIFKFISIMLCPPVIGQCLVEMMVHPPVEGEPSFELYNQEYNGIRNGLKERATALYEAFKKMEGVEIGEPQGSMYLFPTITLPEKAIEAAKEAGKKPDDFYCLRLLDNTGVCVVPGSGFGQREGTLHFRTTFLAPGTEWVGRIVDFHKEFMDKYR